jgi:LAO/AO transport system kinase
MELADLVLVTKADGDLARAANHAASDLRHALHLLRPKHDEITTEVMLVSSPTGDGVAEAWAAIEAAEATLRASGALDALRGRQARAWLWSELSAGLTERFRNDERVAAELPKLQAAVEAGEVSPTAAAQRLLDQLL